MMRDTMKTKIGCAFVAITYLFIAVLWGTVAYVATHFIEKYW